MTHEKDSQYIQNIINSKIDEWLKFNNNLFGFFGLDLAYTSIGMKDPVLFASWSLVFVFGAWLPTAMKMKGILKLCKNQKHPAISYKKILTLGFPYIIGLSTLLLVALGLLTKDATFSNILPGL